MIALAIRLLMALVVAVSSLFSYCGSKEYNPVTGEKQYIGLTARQEISLGLQAADEMIQQHGGLHPDGALQRRIDEVGNKVARNSEAAETPWKFEFHLLRDPETVNAFALPGGQIFVTAGLYDQFTSEDQLAAVLGHEIAHVVARHSAQRLAKAELTRGLTGAVMVASGDATAAQITAVIGELVHMKYGRDDELESDRLGVFFMADAGYDPQGMIALMRILQESRDGAAMPEFFSTHPNPGNRIEKIREAIGEIPRRRSGVYRFLPLTNPTKSPTTSFIRPAWSLMASAADEAASEWAALR